ncbi:M23 family metallopeptidase [Flexithrix dorotheae]|uniref:M23 family metallopeptidase n=1 Tax=Flexithrix dorotheae TaxID=70993 RepID=UPI0003A1625D|nr:M23 family metallopeptidase [Flexithrix dorotheae]
MRYFFILMIFSLATLSHHAEAQKKRKRNKKNKQTKVALEVAPLVLAEEIIPQFMEEDPYCSDFLYKDKIENLVLENSDSIYQLLTKIDLPKPKALPKDTCLEPEFVMLRDSQSVINTKWLTSADYFGIWDTKNIDPYGYKVTDFKDTVVLNLFKDTNWSVPLKNTEINSKYGLRRWRWHHGTDLDLTVGDSIFAAFDGVVRIAKYNYGGYGYYVMLRHENGLETLYGHLKKYLVKPGDEVKAGDLIGLGGNTGRSTGPHLHFETRYKGYAFNPSYLYDFEKDSLIVSNQFALTPDHYKGLIEMNSAKYHRIRSGDSLWVISRKYRTSINTLCRLNGISRKTTLRIGRSLRVR